MRNGSSPKLWTSKYWYRTWKYSAQWIRMCFTVKSVRCMGPWTEPLWLSVTFSTPPPPPPELSAVIPAKENNSSDEQVMMDIEQMIWSSISRAGQVGSLSGKSAMFYVVSKDGTSSYVVQTSLNIHGDARVDPRVTQLSSVCYSTSLPWQPTSTTSKMEYI